MKKTEPVGRCRVRYDLTIGELTGLMRLSDVPWDMPDTWWVDALVTFEAGDGVRRTDGYEMGVTMESGASIDQVKARVQYLLNRVCAVEAVVCHVTPPMSPQMVLKIRELNAALVKERRNREGVSR